LPSGTGRLWVGILLITFANLVGGLSYLVQKLALRGFEPATATLLRNAIGLVPMVLWVARRGFSPRSYARVDWLRVLALGVLAYGLPMWLGIVGTKLSTSANASILILLEPPTILLMAWLFLRERVRAMRLAGVALGLLGAALIVLEGASLSDLTAGENFTGNVILALHGVFWGLHTPIASTLVRRHDAVEVCMLATAGSCLLLVPAAAFEHASWPDAVPWAALGWVVVLGLVVTFLGTVAWIRSLEVLPASTVAGFVFLQPLAGVIAGHLVLGEVLSPSALAGGLIVVAGVFLSSVAGERAARAPAERGA